MAATLAGSHPFVGHFETLRPVLEAFGPSALAPRRAAAIAAFSAVGIPTQKDEEFKYFPLRGLDEGGFGAPYGATVVRSEIEATTVGKIDAFTLVFVNGEFAPELSSEEALPEGVVASSLREALESHPDLVLAHLGRIATHEGKLGSTNDERFVHLNTAFLGEGAFVYVPRGLALERPIHLLFATKADHGPLLSHPRVLIVVEDAAQAKVLESYVHLGGAAATNTVAEVWLGADALLEHNRYQKEGPDAIHLGALYCHQHGGSTYTHNNAAFGAKSSRVDANVWVDGEHTETWLNGAYVAMGDQVVDNHTRIDHAKPNCHSFEVYKGILGGRSSGVFNGKIFVYEDAQKTDAKQTNQAILLTAEASVNTKPQLEIFADDVKCTHGATVGQLREEALFYLRARGIPAKQAQAILVYAFAAEVLEKITLDDVRAALEKELFDKLHETEALPEA